MRVKFNRNLGSDQAARLGLDFKACTLGATRDVSDEVGAALLKKAVVEQLPDAPALKAAKPQAEPKPEPPAAKPTAAESTAKTEAKK